MTCVPIILLDNSFKIKLSEEGNRSCCHWKIINSAELKNIEKARLTSTDRMEGIKSYFLIVSS